MKIQYKDKIFTLIKYGGQLFLGYQFALHAMIAFMSGSVFFPFFEFIGLETRHHSLVILLGISDLCIATAIMWLPHFTKSKKTIIALFCFVVIRPRVPAIMGILGSFGGHSTIETLIEVGSISIIAIITTLMFIRNSGSKSNKSHYVIISIIIGGILLGGSTLTYAHGGKNTNTDPLPIVKQTQEREKTKENKEVSEMAKYTQEYAILFTIIMFIGSTFYSRTKKFTPK